MELLVEAILESAKALQLNINRSKAAILSGAFHVYSILTLDQLFNLTEIPPNEIERLIDELVQKDILVRDSPLSFHLQENSYESKDILPIDNLSINELIVLGWLKGFREMNLEDTEFFTGLSGTTCLHCLLSLIGQNYLKGRFHTKKRFIITSTTELVSVSLSKLPILSQAIIGMLLSLKQRIKIEKIAETLQLEDSQVFLRLLYLLAADVITTDLFIVSRNTIGKSITCKLKMANYERSSNDIAHFSGFYAQILGILLIYHRHGIIELANDFQISKNDLLKAIFTVIAQNDLPLQVNLKKDLNGTLSLELSDYPPQITRGSLDLVEFFLVTQLELKSRENSKMSLSELGMDTHLVLDILGKLALKGVIKGRLKKDSFLLSNSLAFLMESKASFQKARTIGYIQSTSDPSLPDLCEKLQLSPSSALMLIDALNSDDDAKIEIENSKLFFKRLPFRSLPILGFPQDMLIVLGYLNSVRIIDPQKTSSLLQLSPRRIIANIFALIGAGYVKILFRGNEIRVTQRRKLVPQLEALSGRYVEFITLLISDTISLTDLSKTLGQSLVLVRWQICTLVALGFLECQLHEDRVIIKNRPISRGGDPYRVRCYGCSYPLTSDSNWCPKCGLSKQLCVVCQGIIEFGSQVGSCPFCEGVGHVEHLQEYLKIYHSCPVCGQQYSVAEIQKA